MTSYEYPPSKFILNYEPFEPNSQFFVKGYCIFEGRKYKCDFEVAYALAGEIYVVSYMSFANTHAIFSVPVPDMVGAYTPKRTRVQVDFEGVEQKYGGKVKVTGAVSYRNGLGSLFNSPEPPVFIANSYSIRYRKLDSTEENFPLGQSFDVANILDHLEGSTPILYDIGASKPLVLKLATISENSSKGSNTLLLIPKECVAKKWKAEDIATLWCGLISLATGSDIRWFINNNNTRKFLTQTYVRRRNIFRKLVTNGIIEFMNPFWYDTEVKNFVRVAFLNVYNGNISVEAAQDYARIMTHFVEYRLITNRIQDQARLISTTVEELLTLWEEHTGHIPSPVVNKMEAMAIWKDLEENWLPNLRSIIESSDSKYIDAIENRIKTFFNDDILRAGFGKRLKQLFTIGQNEPAWFKENVKPRLETFIITRNKIAHEGRFPSKDSYELFDYYYNMLMILPLMTFSIFGYSGKYTDLSETHRRLNSKKPHSKKTNEQ